MAYQKNETIELEITGLGSEGEGIGRTDAFLWFVKDAVPGDVVRASVMKTKKNYGYARLQEVLIPSPDRQETECPAAKSCGGCTLQALRYPAQLRYKEQRVRDSLTRIGGIDLAPVNFHKILGMDYPFRYRNKTQYPVGPGKFGEPVAGFYAGRTHSIVPCGDCLLGPEENGAILETVLQWMRDFGIPAYDEREKSGLVRHVMIRKGFATGEIMTCVVTNGESAGGTLEDLSERLMKVPGIATVVQNVNEADTNVILGSETRVLAGSGYITDYIGSIVYKISAESFYQVNPVQTLKLYETVRNCAALTGKETVWDLYCGIGTISLFLAKDAGKIYGAEIEPRAVEDARWNAEKNDIRNAQYFAGKAEEILPAFYEKSGEKADVIIVDPPRKGCDQKCLSTILKMAPSRVIYVSCDPSTLARDLKFLLSDGAYRLTEVQPVDMFPQTAHVETVVLMSRKDT